MYDKFIIKFKAHGIPLEKLEFYFKSLPGIP